MAAEPDRIAECGGIRQRGTVNQNLVVSSVEHTHKGRVQRGTLLVIPYKTGAHANDFSLASKASVNPCAPKSENADCLGSRLDN